MSPIEKLLYENNALEINTIIQQLSISTSNISEFIKNASYGQGYNFKRITRGKDQGVVSHPLFLRGRRSVSTLMRRKRVGPQHTGDATLLAQQPDPQLLERSGIGRLGDLSRGLLLEGIELIGELLQGDRCAHRDETDSCRL